MRVHRRRATLADIDVLLELINQAYKHEGRWKVEERRTSLKELTRLLPDQEFHPQTNSYQVLLVVVAEDDEDISDAPAIAHSSRILGHIRAEVEKDKAFFGMYAVWPQLHGRGLGLKLLDELVAEIKATDSQLSRSTATLEASVASENTHLFPFYAKLGFTLTGEEYPVPACFGPLQPGYEQTIFKTISRELKSFL